MCEGECVKVRGMRGEGVCICVCMCVVITLALQGDVLAGSQRDEATPFSLVVGLTLGGGDGGGMWR